jgi:NDP-4-keto-2,6-dideoxyhexose 3-C-methyltransferase
MSQNLVALRETCRVCGGENLDPILSLGDLYVSDFLDERERDRSFKAPLDVVFCDPQKGGCGLLQLQHTVSHEAMYRNYWYRSGVNKTMTDALHGIARTVESLAGLQPGDYVIDIGANDGTLLRGYGMSGLNRIGFEPARNLAQYNKVGTTEIINDFFNYGAWAARFPGKKAKAITAIAMFYDLENPNLFVSEVGRCLDDEGVFIIQMSYLPLMLSTNELGNICHEHIEYYSLFSLENLLDRNGLEAFDVELNDVNGGSFRTYIRHKGRGGNLSVPIGADIRVEALREYEKKLGLASKKVYEDFVRRVEGIKKELTAFVKKETARGKKIYIYGASTKGNTVLQYFGIDHSVIGAAAERNPDKWGKKTVGTLIPIISEEQARNEKPDYFLVLPWHFLREFRAREQEFFKRGGKFIVPFPELKIIER